MTNPKNLRFKIPLSKSSEEATKFAKQARGGEIYALTGDLGSGKTTFAKAFGKTLGIRQNIASPTFVMMQEYPTTSENSNGDKIIFYHLDLYRTKSFREVESLGITEWWGHPETITVIEWADKITEYLPKQTIHIELYRDI